MLKSLLSTLTHTQATGATQKFQSLNIVIGTKTELLLESITSAKFYKLFVILKYRDSVPLMPLIQTNGD